MTTTLKSILMLATCCYAGILNAQVSSYAFTQSQGTYTELTGANLELEAEAASGSSALENVYKSITLPFTFNFNGTPYTTAYINSNGALHFGSSSVTQYPITDIGNYAGSISGFGRGLRGVHRIEGDLTSGSTTISNVTNTIGIYVGYKLSGTGIPAGTTVVSKTANSVTMSNAATSTSTDVEVSQFGKVTTKTTGTAPNRTFTVQFKSFSTNSNQERCLINFQINIFEANGVAADQGIQVVYGDFIGPSYFTNSIEVGLRGPSNNDFNARYGSDSWATTVAAYGVYKSCFFHDDQFPPSGLTFTWGDGPNTNPTSIVDAKNGIDLSIYPNPASQVVHVQLNNIANADVQMNDMLGQVVYRAADVSATKEHNINTSDFAPGIYFIKVSAGGSTTTRRLVIN